MRWVSYFLSESVSTRMRATKVRKCMRVIFAIWALFVSTANAQEVYRCGNSYSSTPCEGAKAVDVTPAVINPDGPLTKFIHLCKRPEKEDLWWVDSPCDSHGWTAVDKAKVPTNVEWKTQISIARRQRADALKKSNEYQDWRPVRSQGKKQENTCETLSKRVEWLDSAGRAGGTVRQMEWLRQERQDARDRQFREGC